MILKLNKKFELHNKNEFEGCWDYEHCINEVEKNYKDVKNRIKAVYVKGVNWIVEMEDGIQHKHNDYVGVTAFRGNLELSSCSYYSGSKTFDLNNEKEIYSAVIDLIREIYALEKYSQKNTDQTVVDGVSSKRLYETNSYDQKTQEELSKMIKIVW